MNGSTWPDDSDGAMLVTPKRNTPMRWRFNDGILVNSGHEHSVVRSPRTPLKNQSTVRGTT